MVCMCKQYVHLQIDAATRVDIDIGIDIDIEKDRKL